MAAIRPHKPGKVSGSWQDVWIDCQVARGIQQQPDQTKDNRFLRATTTTVF